MRKVALALHVLIRIQGSAAVIHQRAGLTSFAVGDGNLPLNQRRFLAQSVFQFGDGLRPFGDARLQQLPTVMRGFIGGPPLLAA